MRKCLQDKVELNQECRILRPDGTVRYIAARGRVFLDPQGNSVRVFGACLDVTERELADKALRQRERELGSLAGKLISARRRNAGGLLATFTTA